MTKSTTTLFCAAILSFGGAAALADVTSAPAGPTPPPAIQPNQPPPAQPAAQPAGGQPAESPAIQPPRSVYDQAFDEAFKKATQGWLEDPFRYIGEDMQHCERELTALKTDKPVQVVQEKVVTRLDAVIKLLEKQCSGGGGGSNPNRPLEQSIIAKGKGGQGEMHDPKAGDKQWASLPPKQREQILQSQTEGFPPGFESILQSYYERLAQEQVEGDDAGAAAGDSSTTPAPGGAEGAN